MQGIELIEKAQAAMNGYDDAHDVRVVTDLTAAVDADPNFSLERNTYLTDGVSEYLTEDETIRFSGASYVVVVVGMSSFVSTVYVTMAADPVEVAWTIQNQEEALVAMLDRAYELQCAAQSDAMEQAWDEFDKSKPDQVLATSN